MAGLLAYRKMVSFSVSSVLNRLKNPVHRTCFSNQVHSDAMEKRVGDVIIKRFNPDDHEIMSDFLLRNYFMTEPMGIALGLNVENEMKSWFHKYVKAKLSSSPPVSTQAVDANTNELVAVLFAAIHDPNQPKVVGFQDFVNSAKNPVFSIICRFLEELEEGIDAAELLGVKSIAATEVPKTLTHEMVSVSDKYKNRGIARALVGHTDALALKVSGCKASQVLTTSEYVYKIYLHHEYQVIREVEFMKYVDPVMNLIFSGKQEKLKEHLTARIMIKGLM